MKNIPTSPSESLKATAGRLMEEFTSSSTVTEIGRDGRVHNRCVNIALLHIVSLGRNSSPKYKDKYG